MNKKKELAKKIEETPLDDTVVKKLSDFVDNEAKKAKSTGATVGATSSKKKVVVLENVTEGLEALDKQGKTGEGIVKLDAQSKKKSRIRGNNIIESSRIGGGSIECKKGDIGVQNIDHKKKKVQTACVSPDALQELQDFEKKKKEGGR